jgi:hypothetical protein
VLSRYFVNNSPQELDKIQHVTCSGHIPRITVLFLSCVNAVCFGQTVSVRLVNLTDESPVSNQRLYVSGISGKAAINEEDERLKLTKKPFTADLSLVTDTMGRAEFDLPKPAPAYFYIRAALSGPDWDCTCLVRVSTEEVVQKGFVVLSPYAAKAKPTPPIQPKSGEVLFALRPTPFWVRFLWPLLKG